MSVRAKFQLFREAVKKNGEISYNCQITSYPLPPQPDNDKIDSDKKLEVWPPPAFVK